MWVQYIPAYLWVLFDRFVWVQVTLTGFVHMTDSSKIYTIFYTIQNRETLKRSYKPRYVFPRT